MPQVIHDVLPPRPPARGAFTRGIPYVCIFEEVSQYKDGV